MRTFVAVLCGLAAGAGVLLEAHHIGLTVDALVSLGAIAVDACVTVLVAYIWDEIATADRDVARWHREAQERTDARRAADQAILDAADLARADW